MANTQILKGIKCPKSGKLMLDREAYFESPGFPGVRFWKNAFGRTTSGK